MAKEKTETPIDELALETKVNPFDTGVSYATFLEALGENEISEYLKDICSDEQIDFIEKELETLKNK
jgi:hypothetical protein